MPPTDLSAYCRPVDNASAPPPSIGGGGFSSPNKRPNFGGGDPGGDDGGDNKELKRRCIDYHTPAVIDLTSRLYRKPNRRAHALPGGSGTAGYPYMQCHTNYLRWMGLPIGEGVGGDVVPSMAYLTYCAHVTRAKNSNPVM